MRKPDCIDYTQFRTWMECPLKWFERYVREVGPPPPTQPRRDAIALGQLFHAGMEELYGRRRPSIPEEAVREINPATETLLHAQQLVHGYVEAFPRDLAEVVVPTEKMVVRPASPLPIAAKVDAYFKLEEDVQLDDGTALQAGWWIQEYKTTTLRDKASFMRRWIADKQADFQLLALSHAVGERVQGVLVCCAMHTLPRPALRKCKACQQSFEYEVWVKAGAKFSCPSCGNIQHIMPPANPDPPEYWRIPVVRTDAQLAATAKLIERVSCAMMEAYESGDAMPNFLSCTTPWSTCDYFVHHNIGPDATLVHINSHDYRKERVK